MRNRFYIAIILILIPLTALAQASGGQIIRTKPNRESHVPKKNKKVSIVSPPSGYENGVPYVDLGLSVKWGYYNVGASVPEASGNHYAWGETGSKSEYGWGHYFDSKDTNATSDKEYTFYIYNCNNGLKHVSPNSGNDAARAMYGGSWRMPTRRECEELKEKCSWTEINYKGVDGYVVKAQNGNSIFLPEGFSYEMLWGRLNQKGETYYWTSDLFSDFSSRAFSFHLRYDFMVGRLRCYGQLIRPVLSEIQSPNISSNQLTPNERTQANSNVTIISQDKLKKYNIVVCSYTSLSDAKQTFQDLNDNGFFSNIYLDSSNTYRVLMYMGTISLNEAKAKRDKAREKYPDAWILKVENGHEYIVK